MYVAISQKLKDHVVHSIDRLRDSEMATTKVDVPRIDPNSTFGMQLIWQSAVGIADKVPQAWLRQQDSMGLEAMLVPEEGAPFRHTCRVSMTKEVGMPPDTGGYGSYRKLTQEEAKAPELAEYFAAMIASHEIKQRWDKIRLQVLNFLDECKSLNEALKLWPQLNMYVPKDYLDRVAEKAEAKPKESRAADALKNLDTNLAVSSAVIARMSGASTS
jgi:hypothetical protein